MTLAAVDCLVHHATIFEINLDSYRRRAALGAIAPLLDLRLYSRTRGSGWSARWGHCWWRLDARSRFGAPGLMPD